MAQEINVSSSHFCVLCNVSLELPPEEPEPVLVDLEPEDKLPNSFQLIKTESGNKPVLADGGGDRSIETEGEDTQTPPPVPGEQVPESDSMPEVEQVSAVSQEHELTNTSKDKDDTRTEVAMDIEETPEKHHPLAVLPTPDEDLDTLKKYLEFLSSVLHIDIKSGLQNQESSTSVVSLTNGNAGSYGTREYVWGDNPVNIKTSLVDVAYDEFPFCINCKAQIRKLYDTHAQMKRYTNKFDQARDNIATKIITTYFEQKILALDPSDEIPRAISTKPSNVASFLRRWKSVYSGEAERQEQINALAEEMRDRAVKKMKLNAVRTKVEFPTGTGLTIQELTKMQRMMTACYFTPKMSVVRKKDKLFIRIGIPKDEENKEYECRICHMKFPRERTLYIHYGTHKLKKRKKKLSFQCKVCGELYKDRKEFILHKRVHYVPPKKPRRPVEKFPCELCDKKFPSKTAMSVHQMKMHELPKPHQCEICHESFTTEYHYKKHSAQHTHVDFSIQDIFSCKECSKAFLKADNLNEHLKVHSVTFILECPYCGMPFESAQELEEHSGVHEEGNPYNCEACDRKFPSEVLLISHLKSHRPKPYPCLYCGKPCRSGDGLRKHELTHLEKGQKPYVCEVCDESFIEKKSLHAHSVKHTGKLPYKCSICEDEEGFKDSRDLRKHKIEAHPEQNPSETQFLCDICWYWFATAELLEEHNSKIHEKYKCDVCNKVFKLGDHLRRHSYIHTGEKPFKCEHCQKSFNQESNLKEHMYRHTGIRPHQCPHCPGVGYLRRVQLKEHMQKEHQISNVPTLPMGRASQNARKAGTHPVQIPVLPETITSDLPNVHTSYVASEFTPIPVQPVFVNHITLDEETGRLAPIIMKSLQNRSNQSMIVRRGLQPSEPSKEIPALHIKTETVPDQYQGVEQQQYVIYI